MRESRRRKSTSFHISIESTDLTSSFSNAALPVQLHCNRGQPLNVAILGIISIISMVINPHFMVSNFASRGPRVRRQLPAQDASLSVCDMLLHSLHPLKCEIAFFPVPSASVIC
jgi:hypothetical protein